MDASLLLTPQPPEELKVPIFIALMIATIVKLVRNQQPPSDVTRDAARLQIIFGICLAAVGLILMLASFIVDAPLVAYLISGTALVAGLLYAGYHRLRTRT